MGRRLAVLALSGLALGCAMSVTVLPVERSRAASSNATFVIPADDSYGVAECTSHACGKVVADQWCSAQGFARSVSFGIADPAEVTGSIAVRPRPAAVDNRPISITCE